MAGTKGRSGGARPGAGRPKKPKQEPAHVADSDMLKLLQDIALGKIDATTTQVRAAIAAVQYTHTKRGDGGKKDEIAEKAKRGASQYAPTTPPKLVVSNR